MSYFELFSQAFSDAERMVMTKGVEKHHGRLNDPNSDFRLAELPAFLSRAIVKITHEDRTRTRLVSGLSYVALYLAAVGGPDYETRFCVALHKAIMQASGGKGQERHGGIDNGDWIVLARCHGIGFLLGQAHKKILEAPKLSPDACERELYGAMVYIAFAIAWEDNRWR